MISSQFNVVGYNHVATTYGMSQDHQSYLQNLLSYKLLFIDLVDSSSFSLTGLF